MSFGFAFYNEAGVQLADSTDYLASIIDVFTISPASTNSKTYPGTASLDLYVVQTREEPAVVTLETGMSLNGVVITITKSGQDTIVSWVPGISFGTVLPITLLVYGA